MRVLGRIVSDLVRRNVRHRGSGAQVLAGGSVGGLPPVLEKSGPGCHVYTMKNRPLVLRLAAAAFFAPVFDAPPGLVRTGWVVLVRGGASSGDVNFRARASTGQQARQYQARALC